MTKEKLHKKLNENPHELTEKVLGKILYKKKEYDYDEKD